MTSESSHRILAHPPGAGTAWSGCSPLSSDASVEIRSSAGSSRTGENPDARRGHGVPGDSCPLAHHPDVTLMRLCVVGLVLCVNRRSPHGGHAVDACGAVEEHGRPLTGAAQVQSTQMARNSARSRTPMVEPGRQARHRRARPAHVRLRLHERPGGADADRGRGLPGQHRRAARRRRLRLGVREHPYGGLRRPFRPSPLPAALGRAHGRRGDGLRRLRVLPAAAPRGVRRHGVALDQRQHPVQWGGAGDPRPNVPGRTPHRTVRPVQHDCPAGGGARRPRRGRVGAASRTSSPETRRSRSTPASPY